MTSICIIGAGPSGITAAKCLLDEGFTELVVYDRGREVGGNWVFDAGSGHSSVFETTHIISSKKYSQYSDYPMPESYADYPSHADLAAYFQGYARTFGLYPYIRFETTVTRCDKTADGRWEVHTENAGVTERRVFDALVVCNGHHWKPRMPTYAGTYEGELLHSHAYKRAEPFRDKRVLVIGGGNSACDVAVETSRVSKVTDLSWRRGYWIVPKFLFGVPSDHIHNMAVEQLPFVPTKLRLWTLEKLLLLANGSNDRYGLPPPDHSFAGTHPTVNSELLYFIRHGRIHPRPDIERWEGKTVRFLDGTSSEYDAVIACTGYEIRHPFFDPSLVDFSRGPVPLYLRMLPETHRGLYFIGLFQPIGCIWPAAELQSRLMAKHLRGKWRPPNDLGNAIRYELEHPDVEQLDTPRHTITVDFPKFRDRLVAELARSS